MTTGQNNLYIGGSLIEMVESFRYLGPVKEFYHLLRIKQKIILMKRTTEYEYKELKKKVIYKIKSINLLYTE